MEELEVYAARSDDVEIVNNRVQVDVLGDAAIRFFGQVSGIKASGNKVTGGRSDLADGVVRVGSIGSTTELPKDQ